MIECRLAFFNNSPPMPEQKSSTYRILGLGLVTHLDAQNDVFIIESVDKASLENVTKVIADEKARYEIQLYAQLTNQFKPFAEAEVVTRVTDIPKRDAAFRDVVLDEYEFSCAVCELKFKLNNLVEATAAHIVSKRKNGTDDPRNGLSLCRTHHWAFDVGIFSLSDAYEILPSGVIQKDEARNFRLEELRGKNILLPQNKVARPHPDALEWHRSNVWLK
jgi:predicted restriction endonuclease